MEESVNFVLLFLLGVEEAEETEEEFEITLSWPKWWIRWLWLFELDSFNGEAAESVGVWIGVINNGDEVDEEGVDALEGSFSMFWVE